MTSGGFQPARPSGAVVVSSMRRAVRVKLAIDVLVAVLSGAAVPCLRDASHRRRRKVLKGGLPKGDAGAVILL